MPTKSRSRHCTFLCPNYSNPLSPSYMNSNPLFRAVFKAYTNKQKTAGACQRGYMYVLWLSSNCAYNKYKQSKKNFSGCTVVCEIVCSPFFPADFVDENPVSRQLRKLNHYEIFRAHRLEGRDKRDLSTQTSVSRILLLQIVCPWKNIACRQGVVAGVWSVKQNTLLHTPVAHVPRMM